MNAYETLEHTVEVLEQVDPLELIEALRKHADEVEELLMEDEDDD